MANKYTIKGRLLSVSRQCFFCGEWFNQKMYFFTFFLSLLTYYSVNYVNINVLLINLYLFFGWYNCNSMFFIYVGVHLLNRDS